MSAALGIVTGISQPAYPPAVYHPRRVEHVVEAVCSLGCKAVHGVIAQLESGGFVAEAAELTRFERRRVVEELKDVMSVYAYRCAID